MKPKKESESGLERLAYYLGLPNRRLAMLLPIIFLIVALTLACFLPRVDLLVPGGAPIVQLFLEGIWLGLMVFGLLGQRQNYRQKYGELAYQKIALHFFIPAGILMFNGVLRPIWVVGEAVVWFPFWLRLVLGIYFCSVGLLLEYRGVKVLEIDRVVLVYTVFPERGRLVDSALYQFLRHPLYAALAHLGLGMALLSGTRDGFFCFLVFAAKLWIWSKLEEKELVERLGESYKEYMKKVPAFIPRLRHLKSFWTTLLKG